MATSSFDKKFVIEDPVALDQFLKDLGYVGHEAVWNTLSKEELEAFHKWCGELEIANNGVYYENNVGRTTGYECWYGYFEAGYTPLDALKEDNSCW